MDAPIATTESLRFDAALIRRFDQTGPRYTSYPTADRFQDGFGPATYMNALAEAGQRTGEPASLYFHLPFCDTLCYYCGCNKVITRDHTRSATYLRYLEAEMDAVGALLGRRLEAIQLHWGGGTPTFLAADEMRALMAATRRRFALRDDAEVSIEVDPRKVEAATLDVLAEIGFKRMSIGVQDFDGAVQQAVNRIQSVAQTRSVVDGARARGFSSISFDLIYGLPLQTPRGFDRTLDAVLAMAPDRISLYSYAHLPTLFKPQRRIAEADLPTPSAKLDILADAIDRLTAEGYVYIGMDHFARPDDELARAQREGRLHRNFQGYSTHADRDLIAFGVSAISQVGKVYAQNAKTLDDYYARLDSGVLPVVRGIALTAEDRLRRALIQRLMCDFRLPIAEIEREFGVDFDRHFAPELDALRRLESDGLVDIDARAREIRVTAAGRLLVRAVAMVFDAHLRRQREQAEGPRRFSKII